MMSSPARRIPGPWLALLLAGVFSLCTRASAQASPPHTFSLNWVRGEGAEQCASSQLLARAIEQLLGPVLRPASEADVAIEGVVTRPKPGTFAMQARVLTPQGEVIGARSLERAASTCSALTPAILLVLTLTLDPEAAAHGFPTELLARLSLSEDPGAALLAELEAERPRATQAATVSRSKPHVASAPKMAARPRLERVVKSRRWSGSLQVAASGVIGLLPHASGGPGVSAELTTPWRVSLALAAEYWAPTTVSFESFGPTRRVHFSAVQGQLVLCVPFSPHVDWQLAGCLGGALGARWIDARELASQLTDRRRYGGPAAQVSVRYAFNERWFAALDVSGALLFRRDRFTYDDVANESQLLFEPEAGAAWSALGVGVRL